MKKTIIILSVITNSALATTGTGQYHFGPDVSENYACAKAESSAKVNAIRSVLGETVTANEQSQCIESNGDVKCGIDSTVYSLTDSYIKSVKSSERHVKTVMDRKVCTVDVNVEVTNKQPKIDAFIEGRFLYKHGDEIQWTFKTSEPAQVYVFHVEGKLVKMVWTQKVDEVLTIPPQNYKMIARASKFDESMVFVFTQENPKFMREYSMEDFNNKLMNLPISDRRIIRRNLVIEQ